jgi:hypothetical protein
MSSKHDSKPAPSARALTCSRDSSTCHTSCFLLFAGGTLGASPRPRFSGVAAMWENMRGKGKMDIARHRRRTTRPFLKDPPVDLVPSGKQALSPSPSCSSAESRGAPHRSCVNVRRTSAPQKPQDHSGRCHSHLRVRHLSLIGVTTSKGIALFRFAADQRSIFLNGRYLVYRRSFKRLEIGRYPLPFLVKSWKR